MLIENLHSTSMHVPIWLTIFLLAIIMYLSILSLQSYFNRSLLICPKCRNHPSDCQVYSHDYFLKCQKNNFLYPNATFNGTPVMGISKAAQNNWTHPSKVNIKWATAICLKKINCCLWGVSPSHSPSGLNKHIIYYTHFHTWCLLVEVNSY